MVDLEWAPEYVPHVKLGLHTAQIFFGFTIWCLEIAVFVGRDAKVVVNNAWTFAVCFLSIPAWLYLIMAPRWPQARRIAEPKAMLVIDVLFAVLWLSAFATQAAYNTANQCGQVCNLSKAIVGLGVFATLLWVGSSLVSSYCLKYYNFHGTLPGYDSHQRLPDNSTNIDPDKAAFSTADEDYERVNLDDQEAAGAHYAETGRYGTANPYSADDFGDPDRYGSLPPRADSSHGNNDFLRQDTEYTSGGGVAAPPAPVPYGGAPHRPYTDEPAVFPAGNYDRGHP
ncbi:membrane-associating domain-containing protein [Hirsutella rhossiliensis]|uniref:Membrane-associating domain-containing protein n=1 Tax=Hirsutella rhossiliensis TaxID=111463 RepID=A0A9P8N3M7_9HYPO|nr:membrane-associating domain-containing protein [Hirsutella rhossiliensis]KAH0965249.1 membrane-associating domain-containing protein [Hirsutella rhossiliensis]